MLDTWEGIKQLKASLWALVSAICCPVMWPQLPIYYNNTACEEMSLMVSVFHVGQHWLFKLGSESPAGGERHS